MWFEITFVEHQGFGSVRVIQPFRETLLNMNGIIQSFPSKVWQPDVDVEKGLVVLAGTGSGAEN